MPDLSLPLLVGMGMIGLGTLVAVVIAVSIVRHKQRDSSFDD